MDKATFLNLAKSEVKKFEVEGEELYAKALSVASRDVLHPIAAVFSKDGFVSLENSEQVSAYRDFRKKLVSFSLCDKDGKQLLKEEDLNDLDDGWIDKIYSEVSGLFKKKN